MLREKVCATAGPTGRSQVLSTNIWRIGIDQPLPRERVLYGRFLHLVFSANPFCFPAHNRDAATRSDAMRWPLGPTAIVFSFQAGFPSQLSFALLCFVLFSRFRRRRTAEHRGSTAFLRLCNPSRAKTTSRAIPKRRRQRRRANALFALVQSSTSCNKPGGSNTSSTTSSDDGN